MRFPYNFYLVCVASAILFFACQKDGREMDAVYNITAETSSVYIEDWYVLGSFTQKQDSLLGKKLYVNPENS